MRTPAFWILATACMLAAAAILGTNIHLPALLVDHGVSEQKAAVAAGVVGASTLVARVVVGWSLDRVFAARIAVLCFLPVAVACVLLALGVMGPAIFVYPVLLGFAIGAEVDIVSYTTSRYFGQKNFSQIYGYLFAAFILGTSIGPSVMGVGHDLTGSYTAPLMVNAGMILVAAMLMRLLGPYPDLQSLR